METSILEAGNNEHIKLCAGIINNGGLVAFPTETVYGLGANAFDENAVSEIFRIKGRQQDNPLIVHVASLNEVEVLVKDTPGTFRIIAEAFWPGPLTLVMKKNANIPIITTAGLDTVAIRMPEHPAALALIRACGKPLAAPSANPSGKPSPTKAIHVMNDLKGRIPYILDGGDCRVGLESTVLDITNKKPRLLRPGGITIEELREVLSDVETTSPAMDKTPRSPGMKYRHYAPNAPLSVVLGPPGVTADYIKQQMSSNTAALMFDEYRFDHPNIVTYGPSTDQATQANRLFGALRKLDNMDISVIYAQTPDEKGMGRAIANRIKKAAGNNIVDLRSKQL